MTFYIQEPSGHIELARVTVTLGCFFFPETTYVHFRSSKVTISRHGGRVDLPRAGAKCKFYKGQTEGQQEVQLEVENAPRRSRDGGDGFSEGSLAALYVSGDGLRKAGRAARDTDEPTGKMTLTVDAPRNSEAMVFGTESEYRKGPSRYADVTPVVRPRWTTECGVIRKLKFLIKGSFRSVTYRVFWIRAGTADLVRHAIDRYLKQGEEQTYVRLLYYCDRLSGYPCDLKLIFGGEEHPDPEREGDEVKDSTYMAVFDKGRSDCEQFILMRRGSVQVEVESESKYLRSTTTKHMLLSEVFKYKPPALRGKRRTLHFPGKLDLDKIKRSSSEDAFTVKLRITHNEDYTQGTARLILSKQVKSLHPHAWQFKQY